MLESEKPPEIRERTADQQAVIELIELRDYEAMLPPARDILAALEMARRHTQWRLDANHNGAGIQ
jgi:hypothetical protein